MKQYTVGKKVLCDFPFGGKPKGKVVEVVKPGNGRSSSGEVYVKITEPRGAYSKGQIVTVPACYAVPVNHIFRRGFFVRVRTDFEWVKPTTVAPSLWHPGLLLTKSEFDSLNLTRPS